MNSRLRAGPSPRADPALQWWMISYATIHILMDLFDGWFVLFAESTRRPIMDVVRVLLAIFLPPLGVFLQVGLGLQFWLNILLTLLGYIPGIIHAVWVITRR